MSTKEKIIDAALTLFAENGYDGTSMERIAENVGIKAPSLYKHFKGKEDILNVIIETAELRYEEYFGSENNIGKIPSSKEEFIRVTMERIRFTLRDPMIRRIRVFLVQEQFRSEKLARITTRHQIDGLQKMYGKILEGMMKEGLLIKDDPEILAMELTAPATLLIAKADRQPRHDKEILESIEKHMRHFCDVYMNNPGIQGGNYVSACDRN